MKPNTTFSFDNDFSRVRRTLLHQGECDRIPFFELSIDKLIKSRFLGRPVQTSQDEVDFWQAAGYDFVSVRAGVRSIVRGLNPAVKAWRDAQSRVAANSRRDGWVDENSGFIRTRQDFEQFPWPQPEDLGGDSGTGSLAAFLDGMRACLPPGMKLIVQLGYIFMGAWQVMGFENFCLQLADDPDFIQAMVDKLAQSQMAVLEILLQYDCVGAIWLADDLCYNTGPVMAPRFYRRYIYPWYVKTIARCHSAGIPIGLHSDGDLTRLLPDLVECGFDCLHPCEPPFNDIVAIKRQWGHRLAVAGNIDLRTTLSRGTPEQVRAEVQEKAAALAPGGGWLLGSSNSIPDFVPFENYCALRDAWLSL